MHFNMWQKKSDHISHECTSKMHLHYHYEAKKSNQIFPACTSKMCLPHYYVAKKNLIKFPLHVNQKCVPTLTIWCTSKSHLTFQKKLPRTLRLAFGWLARIVHWDYSFFLAVKVCPEGYRITFPQKSI